MIALHGLYGIGEIGPGDDLGTAISQAIRAGGHGLEPGDVVCVTQKIVSKAEGRMVSLSGVTPGVEARSLADRTRKDARLVELVLRESSAVLRAVPNVLITRHRLGMVMANAGIDRSNVGRGEGEWALLLPLDPDGSAERIRAALQEVFGVAPAVVVTDSFGRAWRQGVVGVAIGAAGLPSLVDRRGEADRDGRRLEVTQVALADALAAAAGLVSGEGAEGIPAVLLRGLGRTEAPVRPASALLRAVSEDLFP